jgi:phosphoglycerate kinase
VTPVARFPCLDDLEVTGRKVLLRVDINSPIDPGTGQIADFNRIDKSLPSIRDLADRGARLVLIAHQGDTLDYHNLVDLARHAAALSGRLRRLGRKVQQQDRCQHDSIEHDNGFHSCALD